MWRLAATSESLEANSEYAYLMLCHYFAATCLVADAGEVVGYITGFRPPRQPDTLFVWQIGVAASHRRQGIAARMLLELLRRQTPEGVRFLESTVSPGNAASRSTFYSIARRLTTACNERCLFPEAMFTDPDTDHEAELLFRIGPLTPEAVEGALS